MLKGKMSINPAIISTHLSTEEAARDSCNALLAEIYYRGQVDMDSGHHDTTEACKL